MWKNELSPSPTPATPRSIREAVTLHKEAVLLFSGKIHHHRENLSSWLLGVLFHEAPTDVDSAKVILNHSPKYPSLGHVSFDEIHKLGKQTFWSFDDEMFFPSSADRLNRKQGTQSFQSCWYFSLHALTVCEPHQHGRRPAKWNSGQRVSEQLLGPIAIEQSEEAAETSSCLIEH